MQPDPIGFEPGTGAAPALRCDANRPRGAALGIALVLLLLTAFEAAAAHDRGDFVLSPGFSLAHESNYRERSSVQYTWEGEQLVETHSTYDEHYTAVDMTVSLSCGYFVINHLEVGVSGTTMLTWYSSTNRDNFSVYDAKLYVKRYFDNTTSFTPYLKAEGGRVWIGTGDYREADTVVGAAAGLEFFGTKNVSCFAELRSEYTFYSHSTVGTEWKNEIYLGISWYPHLGRKPKPAATPP